MTALLQSVPGGPELLIVLFIGTLLLLVPLAVSVFIYKDASGRNSDHALAWALGSFLTAFLGGLFGGIVVWILYFVVRDEIGSGGTGSGAAV
jgi:hypothetical protein